jgi:hypothetical protein
VIPECHEIRPSGQTGNNNNKLREQFTAHLESPPRAGFFSCGELIAKYRVPVS